MRYIIVPTEFLKVVNFTQVAQSFPDSLRYSVDGSHFILKYEGEQPEFCYRISQDAIGLEEHTHEEMLEILQGQEWTSQD